MQLPIRAHHSISAVYDSSKPVTIDGTVSRFHFVNPHPYLILTVVEAGVAQPYHLEMDNLGELAAVGMSGNTFHFGDRVTVTGSQSRTEPHSLYVRKLVRPADGFEYEQVGASPVVRHAGTR
jgi:hypothetical protein